MRCLAAIATGANGMAREFEHPPQKSMQLLTKKCLIRRQALDVFLQQ